MRGHSGPPPQVCLYLVSFPSPGINVRMWQVLLLSFCTQRLSQLAKICSPGISWYVTGFYSFGPLLYFFSVTFPLEPFKLLVSVTSCGSWPCAGNACASHPHLSIFPLFWLLLSPCSTLGFSSRM